MAQKDLRVVSLFSGMGGMDLGLEGGFTYLGNEIPSTRFQTVFANDVYKPAAKVWPQLFREGVFRTGSILDFLADVKAGKAAFPENIDILTGGFPCQDFSTQGKQRGLKSPRGRLYKAVVDALEIVQPKVFLAENVRNILYCGNTATMIKEDFEDQGYNVHIALLNAKNHGVPQNRGRVFFVGVRDDLDVDPKTLVPTGKEALVTAAEAFEGLTEPEESTDIDQQKLNDRRKASAKFRSSLHNIVLSEPSCCITAQLSPFRRSRKYSKCPLVQKELDAGLSERRLTTREALRLQSFPDTVTLRDKVSMSGARLLIGNAVPPLLANAWARRIQEVL